MALFGKKAAPPEPRDRALEFFTVSQADHFRTIARNAFAENGLEVDIYPDHAVDSSGRQFGFWNIATQCADARPRDWPRLLSTHVRRITESMDAPDPFQDLEADDAAARTYLRLYAADALPSFDAYPHREFAPGIVELLALDLPETVAIFDHEHANRLGGVAALRASGLANLRGLSVEHLETVPAPGGGDFTALLGNSVYTGSRAVLLPRLATDVTGTEPGGHGWLMSVPNRHQVVQHLVRDVSIVNVIDGMARFAMAGYSDAPGPVSPHVFWWDGEQYEQLTRIDQQGNVSVHPSSAFVEVLNRLPRA